MHIMYIIYIYIIYIYICVLYIYIYIPPSLTDVMDYYSVPSTRVRWDSWSVHCRALKLAIAPCPLCNFYKAACG